MSERTRNVLDDVQSGSFSPITENGLTLHPATADLVSRFMGALAEKLAAAEAKYGYSDGWASPIWQDECRRQLHHHAAKGDPRDVAAYAAFCWHHGWSTVSPIREPEISRTALIETMRQHIKADAVGLAPAVIAHYLVGFEEAADAILNLAHVGGRGEEGSSRADLSPPGLSDLDRVWAAVNVLGAPDTACTTDEDRSYCRAIGDALSEIEKLGGRPQ